MCQQSTGHAVSSDSLRGWAQKSFPFDMDRIELEFRTNSTFSSFDGTLRGSKAKGKSYQMRPVQEPNEGKWLWLRWSGEVPEWELHGVSTKLKEEEPSSNGQELTRVWVNFHVSRKSGYYFWKALLPLYLLTALSMGTFHFSTDNLSDRYGMMQQSFRREVSQ